MSFINTYRPLFHIELLHHYFLDEGTLDFDKAPLSKEVQLETYDFKEFISIIPSSETLARTIGQKIVLKHTNSGLTAFIKAEQTAPNSTTFKPYHELSLTADFTFLLHITDPLFGNYSLVPSVPERPFYFSNIKPGTEGNSFTYIDTQTSTTPVSNFSITQNTYTAVATTLSETEKRGLFGIVHLGMRAVPPATTRNILNANGTLPVAVPSFKIQFLNRSTIWNYRDAGNSNLLHSSDPDTYPLVKNGIVEYTFDGKKRPAANPNSLLFEKDNNGNIIKTISEIYIN